MPKVSSEAAFKDQVRFLLSSDQITLEQLHGVVTIIQEVITKREERLNNGRKSERCNAGFE